MFGDFGGASQSLNYFSEQRSNFPNGKIYVQTEYPFYEPGNLVNGKIYMDIIAPVACTTISIEVKGQEKIAFTRFWYESYDDGSGTRTEEKSERIKTCQKFAHYKQSVY